MALPRGGPGEATARPRVGVCVLNWNGWPDTVACLRSLTRLEDPGAEILVVDNGSTDGSVEELRRSVPGVEIVQVHENLGFAGGNNVGIRRLLDRGAELVWLLNNDTIVEPGSLAAMVEEAVRDPRTGIVGSVLRSDSEPGAIQEWGGGTYNRFLGALKPRKAPGRPLHWISGASMLLRREVLEDLGLLDERFFFYLEDIDYSLRATARGWRLAVANRSVVVHKGGASVNRGSDGRTLRADRLQARGGGILIGKIGGAAMLVAVPARLGGIVLRRMWRRQLSRIPTLCADFLRGVSRGRGAGSSERAPEWVR